MDQLLDDDGGGSFRRRRLSPSVQTQNGWAGLTLGAVLQNDKTPVQLNRTLFEIFRDDDDHPNTSAKNNWKSFKDRLRLRRAADVWTETSTSRSRQISRRNSTRSPVHNPDDITPTMNESVPSRDLRSQMLRRNSSRRASSPQATANRASVSLSDALAAEREQIQRVVSSSESSETDEQQAVVEEQPAVVVRMSLMDLLEETDRQMGWVTYVAEKEEEEEEEEDVRRESESSYTCSVCMVRHKGAAFIPCGHTFCRMCSRELWVSRGNCPLCNGFILEILDIF